MNENLYRQTVTIRRPKAGGMAADGRLTYEIVMGEGDLPVTVRCHLEQRGRRVFSTQGIEVRTDATMLFRQRPSVGAEIRIDDIVVDHDGAAWKVVGLDTQKAMFGCRVMGRADLQSTTNPVPHDTEVSG
jgi:hypothetical protein